MIPIEAKQFSSSFLDIFKVFYKCCLFSSNKERVVLFLAETNFFLKITIIIITTYIVRINKSIKNIVTWKLSFIEKMVY